MPEQNPTWRIISMSYDGAHAQPLGLEQLALALQLGEPLLQLGLDAARPRVSIRSGPAT